MAGRVVNPTEWDEVAAGETELPAEKGVYGPVPFPVDGVKVQPGRTVSFYVHAPYHVNGCAFRRFAKSWPGYPSFDAITDANADISVGMARATYSQTPFERKAQSCRRQFMVGRFLPVVHLAHCRLHLVHKEASTENHPQIIFRIGVQ